MIDLDEFLNSTGNVLEHKAKELFDSCGLSCQNNLNQLRLAEIDPTGSHGVDDHIEIDFVIPVTPFCIIGEITSRSNSSEVKRKFTKFRRYFDLLRNINWGKGFLDTLGIRAHESWKFNGINDFKGIFITTKLEKVDVDLPYVENIACLYKSDARIW